MRTKKILAATLAGIMALSLAACGGNGSSENSGGTDSSKSLTVAIWDNTQQPGIAEILSDFTKETGIKTELQVVPWNEYWTLLESGATGGDMPDVFWMHSNESQKYMAGGVLLDLTDKIEASTEIDLNNYYQDITELYQLDGKTYAVPKDYDTIGLWYNKTMFDEAGVAYPDETWTWDTLAEAAQKLTDKEKGQYGFVSPAANNQDGYYNLIYDFGSEIINADKTKSGWDNPKTIEAMNWWYDNLVTKAMPPQKVMAENTSDVLFQSGKAAMVIQGSWMVNSFKQNEYSAANGDVAVLPMTKDGIRKTIYNGLGWSAAATTKNPDGAWKLIEYFGKESTQKKQADLGVTMSAYMGTSDSWVKCAPDFNLQAYLDMTKDMVIRPYSKATKIWEDYSQETMVKAYEGQITMEEACKDIAAYMNEKLGEE